jgi:putative MATE family efflux protein
MIRTQLRAASESTIAKRASEGRLCLSLIFGSSFTQRIILPFLFIIFLLPSDAFLVSARPSLIPQEKSLSLMRRNQSNNEQNDFQLIKKRLNADFTKIALPAFVQQVAVPFADLVDSTFLSKLPPEALGGVGVARASQAAVSKLYTSALSKTTISFIAAKCGALRGEESHDAKEELSSVVTTGLMLAAIVGFMQLAVFSLFAGPILAAMGISRASEMAPTATAYMKARAFAAPAATLWLVANGIFRGFGDTLTPLKCSILLNIVNYVLDPVMIFKPLNLGAGGAAAATAIAQTVALLPLLFILQNRIQLIIQGHWRDLSDSMKKYISAGSFILIQTVARIAAFSYCSRRSAVLGSVAASAYSVTFQLGFFITLVCESITVAVQALLSRELADESQSLELRKRIGGHIIRTGILSGVGITAILTTILYTRRYSVIQVFSKNREVQEAVLAALPAFLFTQLVKGLAFPINGVMLGGMQWRFSMVITWIANAVCFATLQIGSPSVSQIWTAWSTFFATQAFFGLVRYARHDGIWKRLNKRTPVR